MGKKFVQKGDILDRTAGGAVAVDSIVVMGDTVGLALTAAAASGDKFTVGIEGVYEVPKVAGVAWAQGDSLDWDASAGAFGKDVTPAAGDVENCAIAADAAGSADVVGKVKLTPGTGTAV